MGLYLKPGSLLSQFLLTFISVLMLTYMSFILGIFVSIVGKLLVLTVISWHSFKFIRNLVKKELISPYKKAVLITGCDTGIGNATALALNEIGFRVYATVLDPECEGAKDLVTGAPFPNSIHVMQMDVTKDNEVYAVYQRIKQELQENDEQLWAVVNNAGILFYAPLDWGTLDNYKEVFEVNTFGTVRVTRAFLPLLRQSKGRVVNNLSVSARLTPPYMSAYAMSKYATLSFSDAVRRENRKWNISVSTIEATLFKAPINTVENFQSVLDKLWAQTSDEVKQEYDQESYDALRDNSPAVRIKYGGDVTLIVEKIVDSVQCQEPDICYHVAANLYLHILTGFNTFFPPEIQDFLICRELIPSSKNQD